MDANAEIVERVRRTANQVLDPCGLAQAVSIGLVDMGLVREVVAERRSDGWEVTIHARVTSPECLHFVYFEREIRAALEADPHIRKITIEWQNGLDWTPNDMSAATRQRLRERREKLLGQRKDA